MKTLFKNILFIFIATALTHCSKDDTQPPVQNWVPVPDSTFEALLVARNIDTDGQVNGRITKADAQAVTRLIMDDESLTDLTGIEAFTNLIELDCSDNNLTSLDISENILLQKLDCNTNALSSLNVDANTNLIELNCSDNNLTSIDISNNISLTSFVCGSNTLNTIDLSNNTNLERLNLYNIGITTLDLSNNTNLIVVRVHKNNLTALDISANPNINYLFCSDNNLSSLNIKNGSNTNFIGMTFYAKLNPNLTSVCVDVVPPPASISNGVDIGVTFTTNCP